MAGVERVNHWGEIMATIVIKDLLASSGLDREAMLAIAGGARFRGRTAVVGRPAQQRVRLFDLSAAKAPVVRSPSR
jgi:hypothetical protein